MPKAKTTEAAGSTPRACANCGTPLPGPYCPACGQAARSPVRHFPELVADAADTTFSLDSRFMHTVPMLLMKPGRLTLAYFAGRRVRFIPPFRLAFLLVLVLFFVFRLSIDPLTIPRTVFDAEFAEADTPAEVEALLDERLAALDETRKAPEVPAGVKQAMDGVEEELREEAAERIEDLQDAAATPAGDFANTDTPAEVEALLDQKLAALDETRNAPGVPVAVKPALDLAESQVRAQAAARFEELQGAELAPATSTAEPPSPSTSSAPPAASATPKPVGTANPFDQSWDPERDPVSINWLPDAANQRLQGAAQQIHGNLLALKSADDRTRNAAFARIQASILAVLPQTLFLMLPVFALLLTILYVFKRRLYAEHLIVALHSHAFLFLALSLIVLLNVTGAALDPNPLHYPFEWVATGLMAWMPVYLLVMQKRVYGQGWLMTLLKYLVVGTCYMILLVFALLAAAVIGLANA